MVTVDFHTILKLPATIQISLIEMSLMILPFYSSDIKNYMIYLGHLKYRFAIDLMLSKLEHLVIEHATSINDFNA